MSELILGLVIVALLAYQGWKEKVWQAERSKMLNAVLSRTPFEFRDLELTDKVAPIKPEEAANYDMVAEADLDDEEFMKQLEQN